MAEVVKGALKNNNKTDERTKNLMQISFPEQVSFSIDNSQTKPEYQTYSCLELIHSFLFIAKKWLPFSSKDSKLTVATEIDFMTCTIECKCEFSSALHSFWRKQLRNTSVLFPFCLLRTNWKLEKTQNDLLHVGK